MRKSLWIMLALGLIVVPSAKADTFVYNVTSNLGLNGTFDLPSFENPANNITTFVSGSTLGGAPITGFCISGNSSDCTIGGISQAGPGWFGEAGGMSVATGVTPSFNGPGTFTVSAFGITTTVKITDVVGAPEPSSLALLPLGLVALLLLRKRNSRSHQLAT